MTFGEFLGERSRSAVAIFHRFRLEIRTTKFAYVFVEGYDDLAFYQSVSNLLRRRESIFSITFGKRNMDRIIGWFYAEGYTDTDTLFIRDGDFDRYLGTLPLGDHVFVTCGYSVENYVCSPAAISRFLKERLCVDEKEVAVEEEVDHFEKCILRLFLWAAPLFGAMLSRQRRNLDTDLDAVDFSIPFKRLLRGAELPPFNPQDFCVGGLTNEDFDRQAEEDGRRYVSQDALMWFRGHQLLKLTSLFLANILEKLHGQLKAKNITQLNKKTSPDFSDGSTFERLIALSQGTEALQKALQN